MWEYIRRIYHKILDIFHLSPLSLAAKCGAAFVMAVALVLILALLLPYIWMGQLTKNAALDAGRAKTEILLARHFREGQAQETGPPQLDSRGLAADVNNPEMRWIRFTKEGEDQSSTLTEEQQEMIKSLKANEERSDNIVLSKKDGVLYSNYVKVFRATENCISCHNPQGPSKPFSRNELIGAAVIQRPAAEISKTILINRVWVIVAGLIAGTGAIVAFYTITQRVILSPIRQLRAIANNVSEGNLDIRSAIKTGDEYERLAEAFNHMLDGLQAAQERLRQANKQLDAKIVELSERNIELFKANKIKSEFLANMSHEFRTPLNAILGFAEILREKPELLKKDKGRRYAENIIEGGKNLLNMINDLLNLAKAEAGKIELHVEKTSIPQLCKAAVGAFSVLTKRKKIKVKLTIDNNIPTVTTDAGKVQQIVYNFLSNAVKFTPEAGRIEIRVSSQGEQMVRIAVSDTGCGIAAADKEKIFEKFRQADGSLTRETTGSGLGLAISKELAGMLAGSVGVESELGKGATFWLDIPVTLAKEIAQAE
ncbi:MAG: HAMP domain-containing histidine kinase [Sedimentisphaerales bacterium]|nr:HAMP domain-containing histidine kinase [Sedimentisphaerales bacterium]